MKPTVFGLALAVLAAAPAAAKDKPAAPPPAVYQAVVDCRALADAAQRLACFDRTVGEMAKAGEARDLVVLDRETMRETRKGLFGFSLPKLKLFGGGGDDDRDEVKEIESTITGVRSASDGLPIITIADGARWKQTEGRNVYPEVGNPIRIKRATLGSYMANVDKRAAVRVMRLP
jgi:hypothetical protein